MENAELGVSSLACNHAACPHAHVTMGQHTPSPLWSVPAAGRATPPQDLPTALWEAQSSLPLWPLRTLPALPLTPANKVPCISQPEGRAGGHLWQHWDLKTAPGVQVGPLGLLPGRLIFIKTSCSPSPWGLMRPLGAAWACFSDPEALSLIPRGRESTDLLRPSHPHLRKLVNCLVISSHICLPQNRARKKKESWRRRESLWWTMPVSPQGFQASRIWASHFLRGLWGQGLPSSRPQLLPPFCTSAEPQAPSTTKCSLSLSWSPRHLEAVAKLTKSRAWSGRQSWSPRLLSVFWTKEPFTVALFKKTKIYFLYLYVIKTVKLNRKCGVPCFEVHLHHYIISTSSLFPLLSSVKIVRGLPGRCYR